jgi:hypothetical protein
MFKLGDRVWVGALKEYTILLSIHDKGDMGTIWKVMNTRNIGLLNENMMSKTAQTMFEALGYELKSEEIFLGTKSISYYHKELKITIDFTHFGNYKGYSISSDYIQHYFDISPELHLAIHQQMIELGWL